jgi:hypothetical protein
VLTEQTVDLLLDVTNPGRWMAHCHIAEHHEAFFYGSDGTRTRDLRRDRPNRAQRRPATTVSERPHLQAIWLCFPPLLRMAEPIVEVTFGPRAGHEMLSSAATTYLLFSHRKCPSRCGAPSWFETAVDCDRARAMLVSLVRVGTIGPRMSAGEPSDRSRDPPSASGRNDFRSALVRRGIRDRGRT